MSVSRVASRYAKPLLDLAVEKNVLEEVKSDFEAFANLCNESRDFLLMLKSPIIPHLKKAEILKTIFQGKVNEMTLLAFETVTRKNREAILLDIAEEFLALYNNSKGIVKAEVTTSFKLTDAQRKEFEEVVTKISGKSPVLEEKIDTSIIGGYILKAGDKKIDQSIAGQLKDIKLKLQTK